VEPQPGDGNTVVSRFAGAKWFAGSVPSPQKADPKQTPIKVGFVNVDAGPIGAMPELHTSTDGAVEFINSELGGVKGRPVELVPCLLSNPLSPDEAQACGRKMVANKVVAVLGGIGLSQGPMLEVLKDNNIPLVGGLPVNRAEMTSPMSFQFSGGAPGAFVAFADQAVRAEGADRIAVVYAEYPAIKSAAVDFGARLAREFGASQVTEIPFPMGSQDYSTVVQKAVESNPDAILVGAADLACAPIMESLADLKSTAQLYLVGSCADAKYLKKVGLDRIGGARFNIENRIDQTASDLADTELYTLAMAKYAPETTARGAATVSFRDAMNLWAIMDTKGAGVTSEGIIDSLRSAKSAPSFDGHPYTCDGQQMPEMPSMCAPQQVIVKVDAEGNFSEVSKGWIDVSKILAEHPPTD